MLVPLAENIKSFYAANCSSDSILWAIEVHSAGWAQLEANSKALLLCLPFPIILRYYSDWVCTAVMSKWRHERSSRLIRNLSNCEREAWKKFRLQRDSNPWPLRYRCSALPTELWSHNCWEQVNFSGSIMPLRVIQHYSDWVCTAVMSKWRHILRYTKHSP